ncbi:MAG: VCBS repeat-containing protein [Myxococcota bacterium]|nr:VCBS repeat-containing protein [Myxococcota bacterium]
MYQLLGGRPLSPQAFPPQGAGFPGSVAAGGDFNGDGYADALVSKLDGSDTRIFVYPGGPDGLEPAPTFTLLPPTDGVFGKAMTALDLNLDGFSDVIVGSVAGKGEAYVFFGRANEGQLSAGLTWNDPTDSDFGLGVAGTGDLNGDGYPDALIHASGGIFHVVFGGAVLQSPVRSFTPGSILGVAGGYLDGDAFADALFFGNSDFALHSGSTLGLQDPVRVGFQTAIIQHSFAVAGDVDGDGADDVAVGVTVNSAPRVQVWFSPDQDTETISPPTSGTSTFGQSLGSIR